MTGQIVIGIELLKIMKFSKCKKQKGAADL